MAFLHSCRGVPLLCRTSASESCKFKNLCNVVEVTSVRAVGGKSLISVVILVENSFRSSNGRSVDYLSSSQILLHPHETSISTLSRRDQRVHHKELY